MTYGYAHPEALVSTDWVADHLADPMVRIVEADEDVLLYQTGHIPGAVTIDWHADRQDPVRRDVIDRAGFARLTASRGIANETTVIFYGDRHNAYACCSFWLFTLLGHRDCRIMNGGRSTWEAEDRPLVRDLPSYPATTYRAGEADPAIRACRDEVLREYVHASEGTALVDVRAPAEYSGKVIALVDYPREGARRGGHSPGAKRIPWARAANEDGTFRSAEGLRALYAGQGITPDRRVVAYGEGSSHTWFVLTRLLGYPQVKNYDGSWEVEP